MIKDQRLMVKLPKSKDSIQKIIKECSEEVKKEDSVAFEVLSNKIFFPLFESSSKKTKDEVIDFLIEKLSKEKTFEILFEHISGEGENKGIFNLLTKYLSEGDISKVLDKSLPKGKLLAIYLDLLYRSSDLNFKGTKYRQTSKDLVVFSGAEEDIENLSSLLKEKGLEATKV